VLSAERPARAVLPEPVLVVRAWYRNRRTSSNRQGPAGRQGSPPTASARCRSAAKSR